MCNCGVANKLEQLLQRILEHMKTLVPQPISVEIAMALSCFGKISPSIPLLILYGSVCSLIFQITYLITQEYYAAALLSWTACSQSTYYACLCIESILQVEWRLDA